MKRAAVCTCHLPFSDAAWRCMHFAVVQAGKRPAVDLNEGQMSSTSIHKPLMPMLSLLLQLKAFYSSYATHPKVVAFMKNNWEGCAQHWAWWGRVAILELAANTNNPLERGFGMLKYTHLNRNTQCTIQQLVDVLVGTWVPAAMKQRELQLAGRVSSNQRQQVAKKEDMVGKLLAGGAVAAVMASEIPGLAAVKKLHGSGTAHACLGDLSCTCRFSGKQSAQGLE